MKPLSVAKPCPSCEGTSEIRLDRIIEEEKVPPGKQVSRPAKFHRDALTWVCFNCRFNFCATTEESQNLSGEQRNIMVNGLRHLATRLPNYIVEIEKEKKTEEEQARKVLQSYDNILVQCERMKERVDKTLDVLAPEPMDEE